MEQVKGRNRANVGNANGACEVRVANSRYIVEAGKPHPTLPSWASGDVPSMTFGSEIDHQSADQNSNSLLG